MHESSFNMMGTLIRRYRPFIGGKVADVGAMDVNGTYKELVTPWANYFGIDTAAGPNVDIVAAPYEVPGGPYDAILCGQVLEHVEDMPRLVCSIADAMRPDGICLLVAPNTCGEHRYPVDCWRVFPDGMDWLLRTAKLEHVAVFINGMDTWGVGKKPGQRTLERDDHAPFGTNSSVSSEPVRGTVASVPRNVGGKFARRGRGVVLLRGRRIGRARMRSR